MSEKAKVKFRIKAVETHDGKHVWCFGINLYHFHEETYIYICFFKWSVSIGYMLDYWWR